MSNNFYTLESGKDVLSFNGDTYLVGKLKALISQQIRQKFRTVVGDSQQDFVDLFEQVFNENVFFETQNITWYSSQEGKKCHFLKVGHPEWQPGRLRIKADIEFCKIQKQGIITDTDLKVEVVLEFCHDQVMEQKPPLEKVLKPTKFTQKFLSKSSS
ncbi:MAG: KGK domain-containing protein [Calothrix sp. MO_167.B12]|nr:KGK domain-containing protein [Calothrix sp. MO_167.B12]